MSRVYNCTWKSDPPPSDRAGLSRGGDGEGGNVLIKVEKRTRQPSKRTIPTAPQNGNPKDDKVSFGFFLWGANKLRFFINLFIKVYRTTIFFPYCFLSSVP